MRVAIKFLSLSIAIFAVSIVGINAQNYMGGQRVSESAIEQQMFRKLVNLPRYGVFDHITFEVSGSTVILGGKVNSHGTKRDAESTAARVPGVTNVINNIIQLPPSAYDDSIRRQSLTSFARTGLVGYLMEPRPSVRIVVEGGRVTLEGYVSSRGDYNLFNILANGVPGVFKVQNNLVIGNARS